MIIWPGLTYFNNFFRNMNSVTQSCPIFCYPMDCNPPGSSVHGISKARILECVAISSSRRSSQLRGLTSHLLHIFCISRQVFVYHSEKKKKKVSQSCPTLCNPMDYAVHGILQARILEWVAFPLSRGSSHPRDQTQVSHIAGRFITTEPPGKPFLEYCLRTYQKIMQERYFSLLYKLIF